MLVNIHMFTSLCFNNVFFVGLDHSSIRLWGLLLFRRVQVSTERAHERYESRNRADLGALDETFKISKTVLRANEINSHFCSIFFGRCERCSQKIQKNGCEELRLPLSVVE